MRRIDDETIARLRQRAASHGVSMEEEVRRILQSAVAKPIATGNQADLADCGVQLVNSWLRLVPARHRETQCATIMVRSECLSRSGIYAYYSF